MSVVTSTVPAAAAVAVPAVAIRRGHAERDYAQNCGETNASCRGFHVRVLLRFLRSLRFPSCGLSAQIRIAGNAATPC